MIRCDLNLLVALDVLLETRNVTHAAARLNLSQPAVSAQLARLRVLFDDPLLTAAPSGRGMTPTPRALALGQSLRAVLRDAEALVSARPRFDARHDRRVFHIAASDHVVLTLGVALLRKVQAEAGEGVQIAFRQANAQRIASQMASGEVDALIGSPRMIPETLKARLLRSERFVMAQRKGHPRGTAAPSLAEYCALRHVLVSTSGGSLQGYVDEQLERLGQHRIVALSVHHFGVVPPILCATDYISTLPAGLVAQYAQSLDCCELPFATEGFSLSLAWHPRAHHDPGLCWLRTLLTEVAALQVCSPGLPGDENTFVQM